MADKYINSIGLGAIRDWIKGKIAERASLNVTQIGINKYAAEITQGNDVFRCDEPTSNLIDMKWVDTTASHNVTEKVPTQGYVDDEIAKKAELSVVGGTGNTLVAETSSASKKITLTSPDTTGKVATSWNDGAQTKSANIATDVYVDNKTSQATSDSLGTVKLNPNKSITLNANGQLEVGGRLGQFPTSTGIYAPNDRAPREVGDYSFLVTDALGMSIGDRALAVVSGYGISCRSASAGTTEYRVTNNYNNRIICKLAEGGFASRDEATSKVEQIVQVVSVTINGSSFTPDSSANDSTNDIVIKTAETLNPDSAITSIRLFGKMGSYATIHTGNGIKSESGGRNLLLGGGVTKTGSSNDNCLVGNGIFSSGNGVAAFGRYHIARKNRGLFAGTGHDSTNAPSEGASAVGQYSYMDANTLFAVGNGSSHTDRRNAFEVRNDGVVVRSPNGTRYKIIVDNSGVVSTVAI